jgi:hypothetical protein
MPILLFPLFGPQNRHKYENRHFLNGVEDKETKELQASRNPPLLPM